jgi:phosphoribosylformylglycinamidine synthase
MDSAKGWAGSIMCNETLLSEFRTFYNRSDTFSLGVCNGCQLMALLGWVPYKPQTGISQSQSSSDAKSNNGEGEEGDIPLHLQPRFVHNASGRFESRWVTVKIADKTPSIMLQG